MRLTIRLESRCTGQIFPTQIAQIGKLRHAKPFAFNEMYIFQDVNHGTLFAMSLSALPELAATAVRRSLEIWTIRC